ncbi:hypothetical protein D3C84_404310 [compost metagenome]
MQAAAGFDGGTDHHVVADHHQVGATVVGGRTGAAGQQRGLAAGIEESDLVAADAVVDAGDQLRAVAAVNLQIGRGQAAPDKTQARGQGDAGADIEGTAAPGVFDGGDQAQQVGAVDAADVAIHGGQVGDAAIERHAAAARRVPAAGGVGHRAVGAGDHAVLDGQHRFGHRHDHGDVGGNQRTVGEGGLLARLRQHVQRALVGEGLVAHAQGKAHDDAAAAGAGGDETAEVEYHRVAGPAGHRDDRPAVGVVGPDLPLALLVAHAPGDGGNVEQGQRQVGAELELLVVACDQVIAELEGHIIARAQFAVAGRQLVVDLDHLDIHGAGRHRAQGRGIVGL